MTTLLEQSQALRSSVRDSIPAGDTLDECLAALDRVDACIQLVVNDDEKDKADEIAGVDVNTLTSVEKAATLALVRARAVAVDEQAAAEAKASEADKVKA